MEIDAKIYVAGHAGLAGSALVKKLKEKGYNNIVFRTHSQLNLVSQEEVEAFFRLEEPEYVFLAESRTYGTGGGDANRAQLIYDNLMIQCNVIHQACKSGVKKLFNLVSSRIYPLEAPQPMPEDCLLTSPLEYAGEPYAIAGIAGIKLCENYNLQYGTNYISVISGNLYGPYDNFNLTTSQGIPALIRKTHLGKCLEENNWDAIRADLEKNPIDGIDGTALKDDIVRILNQYGICLNSQEVHENSCFIEVWGTGKSAREFLWSEEMADACLFLIDNWNFEDIIRNHSSKFVDSASNEIRNIHINIGTGKEILISDLACLVKDIIGFKGDLVFNQNKSDGALPKLLDVTRLYSLGWKHQMEIEEGVERLYKWYIKNTTD